MTGYGFAYFHWQAALLTSLCNADGSVCPVCAAQFRGLQRKRGVKS